MNIYKSLIRPVLFTIDPERAHDLALGFITRMKLAYPLFHSAYSPVNNDPVKIGPLTFRNRLGLAAGFGQERYGNRIPGCNRILARSGNCYAIASA
ncbi:MAG: hypothetical protein IPG99_20115 [Ignavibacteria bacterium]|nr:hypothetical protein [Ignavibacteria bacterium]